MSVKDGLTGLYNVRAFRERFGSRAFKLQKEFSILSVLSFLMSITLKNIMIQTVTLQETSF
jgi:GGDEF domain-containing protein